MALIKETTETQATSLISWWQAATLAERLEKYEYQCSIESEKVGVDGNNEAGEKRLNIWQKETGLNSKASLEKKLSAMRVDYAALVGCLGESPQDFAGKMGAQKPHWQEVLEAAYATESLNVELNYQGASNTACDFLVLVRPLIAQACLRLSDNLDTIPNLSDQSKLAFSEAMREDLCVSYFYKIKKTLLSVLREISLDESLADTTSQARYRFFVERLKDREYVLAFFARYPVLARVLITRLNQSVAFYRELAFRLSADQNTLSQAFNSDCGLGDVTQVSVGCGDRHKDGRSVVILSFSSQRSIVYKPKSLAVDVVFQKFLSWLNRAGCRPALPVMRIVDRGDYGWCEYISHRSCESEDEVRRFYKRQGIYAAVLYALEGVDFHYENVISQGEMPYLIDLEMLVQPIKQQDSSISFGSHIQKNTTVNTSLLPMVTPGKNGSGVDVGGISHGSERYKLSGRFVNEGFDTLAIEQVPCRVPPASNAVLLKGEQISVERFRNEVLNGFSMAYRLLLAQKKELLQDHGPVSWFANLTVRFVLRITSIYRRLLDSSYHPYYLQNGLLRDRLFDKLWLAYQHDSTCARTIPSEQRALHRCDVPFFQANTSRCDLIAEDGEVIPDFFLHSGMQQCRARIESLSSRDLSRQYRIVHDCLSAPYPRLEKTNDLPESAACVTRCDLVTAAQKLAFLLEEQAITHDGHVGWLFPSRIMEKQHGIGQCPVNIYDGLAGIAVFFAAMYRVTAQNRYRDICLSSWHTLCARLRDGDQTGDNCGVFTGWAGIFHTARLLQHFGIITKLPDEHVDWRQSLAQTIESDQSFDLLSGSAGCILALLRCYQDDGESWALQLALQCGQRLLSQAQHSRIAGQEVMAWVTIANQPPLTGFSHGAAGIALALAMLGEASGNTQFTVAASKALSYEHAFYRAERNNWVDLRFAACDGGEESFMTAWCHGAPGIGISRLLLSEFIPDSQLLMDVEHAVIATKQSLSYSNISLCHGTLGNLEFLQMAGMRLHKPDLMRYCQQQLSIVVGLINRGDYRCGADTDALVPGFMNGIAGMGYALLRAAEPDLLPSVLALE